LPQAWLETKIKEQEEEEGLSKLVIPIRDDGVEYSVKHLYKDQEAIVAEVMNKIKEWLETEDLSTFKPLRMTLNGSGGSGKSVVINTIVTLLRKMFGFNDVVKVAAPTGVAAFNVNGETFHHLLGNRVSPGQYRPNSMQKAKRLSLVKKFKTLLALIVDERSLVSSKDLGTAERMISETVYSGRFVSSHSWGGLPVVILVGDDYQLPPTNDGALVALKNKKGGKMVEIGRQAFLECGLTVMDLQGSKRVKDSQLEDKKLLAALRTADDLSEKQVKKLLSLHLNAMQAKHGSEVVDAIKKEAIFLFYTNEKRNRHNLTMLKDNSSPSNPVAICKPRSMGTTTGKGDRRHFDSKAPSSALLCIGAKVALDKKNFCPSWGLHNGATGVVEEIIFEEGKNPNHGDLPLYVVVNFPLYCGPVWDPDHPKHVPIPLAQYRCNRSGDSTCCSRTFVPLCLSYARTIHKFQGMSAGPVDPGKIPNIFKCIVCDPGERHVEGSALGLFYTAVSRATTLGNDDGVGSAIYFTGDFDQTRIRNIGKMRQSGEDYVRVKARKQWVSYLQRNVVTSSLSSKKQKSILRWASTHKVCYDSLFHRINEYTSINCFNAASKQPSSYKRRK